MPQTPPEAVSSSSGSSFRNILKTIGPGILVACAAIGGSHLVWSTRAGADYGWSLVGLILLANLLKLPFFLYGQTYTAATGESLLAGYLRQGRIYVWVFLAINILTGIINIAGVAMISGALMSGYGISGVSVSNLTLFVLVICALLIVLGHYRVLDGVSKVVIIVLTFSTIIAVSLAFKKPVETIPGFVPSSPYTWASFAFLISLLGWMPAPIDLSTWSSLWMFSREKQTGHKASLLETKIDFFLGYGMAVLLAVLFLSLGALVMHGTGEHFSDSGLAFSKQLVNLYAGHIGEWSRPIILTAAFVTMFSTTLTCVDGYPRSLAACCSLLGNLSEKRFHSIHRIWILISVIISALIVQFLIKNLIQLLTFAAVVSFVTSPILAWINFKVMRSDFVPVEQRPGKWLSFISWAGLTFFVLMTLGYIYSFFQASV